MLFPKNIFEDFILRFRAAIMTCTFLTGLAFPASFAVGVAEAADSRNNTNINMGDRFWQEPSFNNDTGTPAPKGKVRNAVLASTTPMQGEEAKDAPVNLIADQLVHDEGAQTVTAMGSVELTQAGRLLTADKISYNLLTDRVTASGNVIINETDGTTYFADTLDLDKDMKDGFVESLLIILADGSRFTAAHGTRKGGTIIVLNDASYTPCLPCKEDPSKAPLWQLRANKVTHDEAERRISYRDAWFELAGVPVAYTPYFSHPDGTVKQKSGFLAPRAGFDSELGMTYHQQYYWAIAPDKDATIGTMVATSVDPVLTGEYRQRFKDAEITMSGSTTYSDRTDQVGGQEKEQGDEVRGHVFADGLWNMNEKWRSGLKVELASDEQYLNQYGITSEDVLENEVYAERFSDRNYMVGRALAFQDTRVRYRDVDQPNVLPEVIASFYGDPNALLGGRWQTQLSALGLYRDGNGQDMARASMETGWQKRYVTNFGLVNTFDALLRGDAYNVQDRDVAADDSGRSTDSSAFRGFAQANWQVSYPFVKQFETVQMVVEPITSVTTGTDVQVDSKIPNEDSQAFSLDPTNLFEANRSPGYDLIEDRDRMTYGLRTGLYGMEGWRGEVFLGQSHRFNNDDNPFGEGTGLSDQDSDYVGQVSAALEGTAGLDYRFQLEQENLTSQRHELDAYWNFWRLQLNTNYFYAKALTDYTDLNNDTALDEDRQQIRNSARFRIFDEWYMTGYLWHDLGEDPGLRMAGYAVEYIGQCLTLSVVGERTLTQDSSGDSGTTVMVRLGLKNLGEIESSSIDLGTAGQ